MQISLLFVHLFPLHTHKHRSDHTKTKTQFYYQLCSRVSQFILLHTDVYRRGFWEKHCWSGELWGPEAAGILWAVCSCVHVKRLYHMADCRTLCNPSVLAESWIKVQKTWRKKPLNGKIYSGVCTFSQVLHIFLFSDWTRARSALLVVCFLKEKFALKQHLELSLSYKAGNFRLKLEVFSSSLLPWVCCHGNLCCRYEITTFWPISSPGNLSPFLEDPSDHGVQTAREFKVFFVFIWWP